MRRFILLFIGLILSFPFPASAQNGYWRHRISASLLSDNNVFESGLLSESASIGRLQIFTEHGSGKTKWRYRLIYEGALDYTLLSETGTRHIHQFRGQAAWLYSAGLSAGIHGFIRNRSGFHAFDSYGLRAINPMLSIHLKSGWNLSLSSAFHQFDDKSGSGFDYNEQHFQADIHHFFSSALSLRLAGKTGRIHYLSDRQNDAFTQMMLYAEYFGRVLVQAEAGFFRLISKNPGHEHTMPLFKIIAAGNLASRLTGRLYWASQVKRFSESLNPDFGFVPETEFEKLDFFIFDLSYDISRSQDIWIRWGIYQNESADRNFLFRKTVLSVGTTRRFN